MAVVGVSAGLLAACAWPTVGSVAPAGAVASASRVAAGTRPTASAIAGDPERGRAIVADRTRGMCLLCHEGPFPGVAQGNLAPPLDGVGERLSREVLRERIADARALNPGSIMPSYHRIAPPGEVAEPFRGRPILDAQQIEDVVAFLVTLREPPALAAQPSSKRP